MLDQISPIVRVNPTIDTVQYTSGDVVGGLLTIGDAAGLRPFGDSRTGVLKHLAVKDNANQKAALTFLFFDQLPTGTYTNNAAFAWGSGDFAKCVGMVNVAASDYTTVGSKAVAEVEAAKVLQTKVATDVVYCVVVTTGTPTYVAASDLEFQFGILRD